MVTLIISVVIIDDVKENSFCSICKTDFENKINLPALSMSDQSSKNCICRLFLIMREKRFAKVLYYILGINYIYKYYKSLKFFFCTLF